MANFLQKIAGAVAPDKKTNLPVVVEISQPVILRPEERKPSLIGGLPNATVVYGIAASILFVMALASLLHGAWFTGILVLLVAGCLMGYAVYFLRNN